MQKDILNYSLEGLAAFFKEKGQPQYHARQVFSWIYHKGITDFESMSDIPKKLRMVLAEHFFCQLPGIQSSQLSRDGTQKFLFSLIDGAIIESVIIPSSPRATFCLSSQVGCKYGCYFCASGMSGYERDLTAGEIIAQAVLLKKHMKPTHIVFMGVGEPFDNYSNVLEAIRTLNAPQGFGIGARRITLSTCGVIPGIKRLMKEGLQVELSVSLHAADDRTRNTLVPVNKKYPLESLMGACREYYQKTNRQITFEYVMIKGINCRQADVTNLTRLFRGFDAKLNLIPCNEVQEKGLIAPGKLDILMFRQALAEEGVMATVRKPRGADIQAACGQLRCQLLHTSRQGRQEK